VPVLPRIDRRKHHALRPEPDDPGKHCQSAVEPR
jgi:hypothetical protein